MISVSRLYSHTVRCCEIWKQSFVAVAAPVTFILCDHNSLTKFQRLAMLAASQICP